MNRISSALSSEQRAAEARASTITVLSVRSVSDRGKGKPSRWANTEDTSQVNR